MNKGDVVQLKSGGPVMTVEEVSGEGVFCTWFDKNKKRCSDTFAPEVLCPYNPRVVARPITYLNR